MQKSIIYKNSKIAFSDEGKGSAVVLLHGFLENSLMWKEISLELVKQNRIISIDLLGHGNTNCLGYIHTMNDMAAAVAYVLKSLRVRRVTLIGHSMGGYVALAFTEKYIEKVKGICLLNSTAQADSEERKKLRTRAIKMAKTNYKNLVTMSITNLFASTTQTYFLNQIEQVKKEALKTSVQGYIACSEGMRLRPNREHILASREFKKLMITGKNDSLLTYKSIVDEAKRTQTQLIEFSNGHMSHIENTKELIVALKNFLKK